jgi:hypothetical protein
MALKLNFNICQDASCKYFRFSETTGAYSASNLNGWNTPNTPLADAVKAELIITKPNNTSVTLDITEGNNTSTNLDDFPTTDSTREYVINSYDLGYTASSALGAISDGMYKFEYRVTLDDDSIITKTNKFFAKCQLECKVSKILADIGITECDCSSGKEKEDALIIWTLFKSLEENTKCNTELNKLNDLYNTVNTLVTLFDSDCGCN